MSKQLTASDILGADDLPRERVECPEWSGHVFIRTLESIERDAWEQCIVTLKEADEENNVPPEQRGRNAGAILISRVACDDKGKPLFSSEQTEELGRKSGSAMARCYIVAARLNHFTQNEKGRGRLTGPQLGPLIPWRFETCS